MENIAAIAAGCYFVCLLSWLVGSMLYEHCVKSVQNTLEEDK